MFHNLYTLQLHATSQSSTNLKGVEFVVYFHLIFTVVVIHLQLRWEVRNVHIFRFFCNATFFESTLFFSAQSLITTHSKSLLYSAKALMRCNSSGESSKRAGFARAAPLGIQCKADIIMRMSNECVRRDYECQDCLPSIRSPCENPDIFKTRFLSFQNGFPCTVSAQHSAQQQLIKHGAVCKLHQEFGGVCTFYEFMQL